MQFVVDNKLHTLLSAHACLHAAQTRKPGVCCCTEEVHEWHPLSTLVDPTFWLTTPQTSKMLKQQSIHYHWQICANIFVQQAWPWEKLLRHEMDCDSGLCKLVTVSELHQNNHCYVRMCVLSGNTSKTSLPSNSSSHHAILVYTISCGGLLHRGSLKTTELSKRFCICPGRYCKRYYSGTSLNGHLPIVAT